MQGGCETSFRVVKPGPDADPKETLDSAYGRYRLIICADDDVDTHDHRQALWAAATRATLPAT